MESDRTIKEAALLCVESFTQCLEVPELNENEWAENRLADMELWISGTGACARGRAALDSRLASRPEARDVIANLLYLLGNVIDECRMQSQTNESSHSDQIEADSPSPTHGGQGRAFSPWSDDSSSDDESQEAYNERKPPKNPLQESMYNIESMQDQLARIAVAVRRSGRRSRLQKADLRFDAKEHQELEGHLVGMLLTQLKRPPQERDSSNLNEVQLRLIHCNLKRRNRFLYAQQHSKGLDASSMQRLNFKQSEKSGLQPDEMVGERPDSKPSNKGPKDANNTIITGTSASKVSENFNLQSENTSPTGPTTASIMSTTAVDLDYPRPPRFNGDAHLFRCPCCCEALPASMADQNRWRKHVADDLSPYTCILTSCNQPHVLFNTKESWRRHILNDHISMTYWICSACGDGSQFKDKKAFVEHLKSSHTATILPDQIPILVDLSEKNTPAEMPRCPLCSWPEEGLEVDKDALLNHIAREIHAFSLRALPWADNNGQESDERIHASSEKVFKWLVDNGLQTNLGIERPSREDRIWHSEYFQQDAYFAGSSHAASSSQSAFDSSRENELDELRREGELTIHEGCDSSGLASHGPETEKDLEPGAGFAKIGLKKYAVGWVCAIRSEYVAAQVFLDDVHERPSNIPPHDTNEYTFGEMGNHNVVIAVLPMGGYGSNSAAIVAIEMARSFPELRLILMVGIGGGAPSSKHDIRLGDVVVGASGDGQSGLLQYDTGRIIPDGGFQQTGYFGPPIPLRNAVHGLAAQYEMDGHNIQEAIAEVLNRKPRLRRKYGIPDLTTDRLYKSDFVHQYDSDGNSPCAISCGDDPSSLVIRSDRSEREDEPTIHYGLIASGNTLMRDARTRDKLTAAKDVLCFEMEAAGLVNRMPCLVIRGICDYADSHKSNEWQGYAAMVATAYAKDLLKHIPLHQVEQEPKISAVLTVIDHDYPTNIGSKHTSIEFTGNNSGVKIGQNKGQISY